jgi:uncharacterized protein YbjT (DUF2867 family)
MQEDHHKTPQRTALLLGASGLVGSHVLELLLRNPAYTKVIIAVRKKLPLINEKLDQQVVDFDNLEEHSSAFKADDVYCCLGTTIKQAGSQAQFRKVDHDYPIAAAKLALEQGAKRYLIISALGADKSSLIFYNRVKGQVEDHLKKMGYQSLHIFQPSLLVGHREQPRAGEKIAEKVMKGTAFLLQGPLKKYRAIDAETVAFAMVHSALQNTPGIHTHQSDEIQAIFDKHSAH